MSKPKICMVEDFGLLPDGSAFRTMVGFSDGRNINIDTPRRIVDIEGVNGRAKEEDRQLSQFGVTAIDLREFILGRLAC